MEKRKEKGFVIPGAEGNRESTIKQGNTTLLTAGLPVHAGNDSVRGFTLIELLVVVLIIGILSAIALPQYQKAVWKSKATQLQILVKSLADAQQAYYLANSTWPTKFSDLDISFDSLPLAPSSSTTGPSVSSTDAVRANNDVELIVNSKTLFKLSTGMFKNQPYKGCGFVFAHYATQLPGNQFYCVEFGNTTAGNFCVKLFGYQADRYYDAYYTRFYY